MGYDWLSRCALYKRSSCMDSEYDLGLVSGAQSGVTARDYRRERMLQSFFGQGRRRKVDHTSLKWIDEATFSIGGHKITLDYEIAGSQRRSKPSDFTMMKSKEFLDKYLEHADESFQHVLEVGIYQGGSFVFLDQVLQPKKLVAVELSDIRIPALDAYVASTAGRTKVHYATSQDEEHKVRTIIESDFRGTLDLVVDDASHFYDQTKSTFKVAFPYVRPGGLYIIEDWQWSFHEPFQAADHPWRQHHSLANLVVDLMEEMTLGKMIKDIEISPHMLKIRRSSFPAGQSIFNFRARRGREVGLL